MTNNNDKGASSQDPHASRMGTIQNLRLAVSEQEVYVSLLEKRKVMRDQLRARLNGALRQSNLETSTNIEAVTEDLLRDLHEMQKDIYVVDSASTSKLEPKIINENESLTKKEQRTSERSSPKLVFSDAIEAQLSALMEDDLRWQGEGEGTSLPDSAPIDSLLGNCQSGKERFKRQKKWKHRNDCQGDARGVRSSPSKSVELLKRMKERDAEHREGLFKGLERVIKENPDAFSLESGTTSEQPPWLTGLGEVDASHLETVEGRQMGGTEDYSDDFEDD